MGFDVYTGSGPGSGKRGLQKFRASDIGYWVADAVMEWYRSFALGCGLYALSCEDRLAVVSYIAYATMWLAAPPYVIDVFSNTVRVRHGGRNVCVMYLLRHDRVGISCREGVSRDEVTRIARGMRDSLFTALVLVLEMVAGDDYPNDMVSSAAVRLAELGAFMDPDLYSYLEEVLELVRPKVYSVNLSRERAVNLLEEMLSRLRYRYVWVYEVDGELGKAKAVVKVDRSYIAKTGKHYVVPAVETMIDLHIDGSNPVTIYITYWVDEGEDGKPTPLLSVRFIPINPRGNTPPLDKLMNAIANWRSLTINLLKKLTSEPTHKDYAEVAKMMIEIIENLGEEVKRES